MTVVYIFWGLAAAAFIGIAADWIALERGVVRAIAWSAIAMKAVTLVMFLGWLIAERAGLFSDWADLTTLAIILVVSLPLLGIALVCDLVALRAARRAASQA